MNLATYVIPGQLIKVNYTFMCEQKELKLKPFIIRRPFIYNR